MNVCQSINLEILRVLETLSRASWKRGKGERIKQVGSPLFQVLIPSSEIFLLDQFHKFIFLLTNSFPKTFPMFLKYLKIMRVDYFQSLSQFSIFYPLVKIENSDQCVLSPCYALRTVLTADISIIPIL